MRIAPSLYALFSYSYILSSSPNAWIEGKPTCLKLISLLALPSFFSFPNSVRFIRFRSSYFCQTGCLAAWLAGWLPGANPLSIPRPPGQKKKFRQGCQREIGGRQGLRKWNFNVQSIHMVLYRAPICYFNSTVDMKLIWYNTSSTLKEKRELATLNRTEAK